MTTEALIIECGRIVDGLAAERASKGWSQNMLSRRMRVFNRTVSNMETQANFSRFTTIIKAADALGMKLVLIPKEVNIGYSCKRLQG